MQESEARVPIELNGEIVGSNQVLSYSKLPSSRIWDI